MSSAAFQRFGPEEISACMRLVQAALPEDLAQAGDITSERLIPEYLQGTARFVARQAGVIAGLEAARIVLTRIEGAAKWEWACRDGAAVEPGQTLSTVRGSLRALLAAERTALNFLQRLSGIATLTKQYVEAIAGLQCVILDTRKTTPGWRVLEKYAVRVGGGVNHRMGLFDGVLIKDNHLAAWRSTSPGKTLADAVRQARRSDVAVEIEVDSLEQLGDALAGDPDMVLLDNMSPEQMKQAVTLRNAQAPKVLLEASGGISLETVRRVAESGVERVSVGALTHSAPALDIGLDFEEPEA